MTLPRAFRYMLFLMLAIPFSGMLMPDPPSSDSWSSWKSKEFNKYIKIEYRDNGKYVFEFKLFKKDNALGLGNKWEEIDHFTISHSDQKHSKKNIGLYPATEITSYEVVADYDKGDVATKGTVKAPDGDHKWDTKLDHFTTDHIVQSKEGEYYFDSVSELWRIRCSTLPCGPWVTFPGYGEAHGIVKGLMVNGKKQDVLVQVWKGFCPRFLDVTHNEKMDMKDFGGQFPGGIGAEVGLYTLTDKSGLSWMPLVTDDVKIRFQLVNRETGEVVVDAKDEHTWWKTKWMTTGSYDKYKAKHKVPERAMDYELRVWLNDAELAGTMATWNWSDNGKDGNVQVR